MYKRQNKGDIRAIKGSLIKLKFLFNVYPLKAYVQFENGKRNPINLYGKNGEIEFILRESSYYSVVVFSKDGFKTRNPVKYRVEVLEDSFPKVEVISPKMNLRVRRGEKIPVIFEAEDDFGVEDVYFVFRFDGKERKVFVNRFSKSKVLSNFTIDTFDFNEGENVFWKIVVYDNDTVSGPKFSESRIFEFEVTSFKDLHKDVQELEKEINQEIFEQLSREMDFKDKYILNFDTNNLKEMISKRKEFEDYLLRLDEKLEKLLTKMEEDPYVNLNVYNEYRGLKDSIEFLRKRKYESFRKKLEKGEFENLKEFSDEIIQELERLSVLSEDINRVCLLYTSPSPRD